LVNDTDVTVILALLEAKAAATMEVGDRMAAVGALVGKASGAGHTTSPELLRALDALELLKIVPEVEPQWLKLQQAQLLTLSGSAAEAMRSINEAQRKAIALMPPEMAPMWFTTADREQRDPDGEYAVRRKPQTPAGIIDDVFGPEDTIYVAQRFRYLTGTEQPSNGKFHYRIKISAELFDEKGEKVKGFLWEAKELDIHRGLPPDQWETARQGYRLPHTIKSEQDYVLRVTITDMLDKALEAATGEITIRVRTR